MVAGRTRTYALGSGIGTALGHAKGAPAAARQRPLPGVASASSGPCNSYRPIFEMALGKRGTAGHCGMALSGRSREVIFGRSAPCRPGGRRAPGYAGKGLGHEPTGGRLDHRLRDTRPVLKGFLTRWAKACPGSDTPPRLPIRTRPALPGSRRRASQHSPEPAQYRQLRPAVP